MYESLLKNTAEYQKISASLAAPGPAALFGLPPAGRALLYAVLQKDLGRVLCIVTPGEAEATHFADDLKALGLTAAVFPPRDFMLRPVEGAGREYEYRRLSVLGALAGGRLNAVCVPAEALLQYTVPRDEFLKNTLTLKPGMVYNREALVERLFSAGYVRRSQVDGPGQFSVRGDIVDIYAPDMRQPARIEYWDDEIDSLASFDLLTQRRDGALEKIYLSPAREVLFGSTADTAEALRAAQKKARGKHRAALEKAMELPGNIKQAKNEVKNTVKAYLSKDAHGEYVIPQIRQRPMLLIGPPGVGKTQIMEQIARECKIGLVAYTITHHTRQSAVGLPFIKEREYDGKSYSVTEYTMSDIIASVYEKMEATGLKEGILFIDEINCVSETLAPTMLQFLQCKTFGNQAVPKGWVIVAAGNPPEYNKSVRDFDMVTLDRVRYISIEADYQVWKEYARDVHIHDALLSYLELHPNNFYRVETDVDGMNFVTARGWEDLSSLLKVYEAGEIAVTEDVIGEFIHHPDIAEDVYAYLEIYRKYNEDYGISDILSGNVKKSVYKRVFDADFDERITVVNLLLSGLTVVFSDVARERKMVQLWYEFLKEYRKSQRSTEEQHALYNSAVEQFSKNMEILKESSLILPKEYYIRQDVLRHIKGDFDTVMDDFTEESEKLSTMEDAAGEKLNHAFDFVEDVFSDGQEMLVFVTELTITPEISSFLAENECEKFDIYNEKLMVGSNRTRLLKELER